MTSPANRLALHRLSRFISRQRPNVSNTFSKVEVHQGLRRNLPYLNPKVVTQASYLNCNFGESPHLWKVTKGHTTKQLPVTEKFLGRRLYSTVNQGCSQDLLTTEKVEKSSQMADMEPSNYSAPNDTWTVESLDLYKKLKSDLIEQGNGDWLEHKSSIYYGERRLFTKALVNEYPGKFFEYVFFFSKNEKKVKGVIQFGSYTQGPPGCVHGGASASMMDSAIGVCVNKSFPGCVTASLTMNYKSLLPLGATAFVESWVDKVEGRKVYALAELRSPDGKVLYSSSNALFIQLQPQGEDADKWKNAFGDKK
nr:acyl-coenzyme A thioesterase THEM4-like [Pocillopora verrucosa]